MSPVTLSIAGRPTRTGNGIPRPSRARRGSAQRSLQGGLRDLLHPLEMLTLICTQPEAAHRLQFVFGPPGLLGRYRDFARLLVGCSDEGDVPDRLACEIEGSELRGSLSTALHFRMTSNCFRRRVGVRRTIQLMMRSTSSPDAPSPRRALSTKSCGSRSGVRLPDGRR